MRVVADTSALVSLGTIADRPGAPLAHLLDAHTVTLPERVVAELEETAAYDDPSGCGARNTLDRREAFTIRSVELDETFPLDDGENAAVTLANETDATQFLCDEFNRLALVHASLTTARLITTPTLLLLLAENGTLSAARADEMVVAMSEARSWSGSAYVERTRETIQQLS